MGGRADITSLRLKEDPAGFKNIYEPASRTRFTKLSTPPFSFIIPHGNLSAAP